MRRWWLVLSIAALSTAGVAGAAPQHGRQSGGYFAVPCGFSHRNLDDPIVFPGQPGASHDHTFFGNAATNASSTDPAALVGGATTCRLRADASAYWVPTLLVGDRPVEPIAATVYYVRRTEAAVQPFPAGLKLIAGNSKATTAQSTGVTYWSCGGRAIFSAAPTCRSGFRANLRLVVNFPNCWDGKSLDSADHKSHLAYSTNRACPASHPVAVPALTIVVHYPATNGETVALSSGGTFSGHADFVNAWNQRTLQKLVDRYLNGSRRR